MHIELKSCKLNRLRKLIVQYGIETWFDKRCEFKPPLLDINPNSPSLFTCGYGVWLSRLISEIQIKKKLIDQ